MNKVWTRCVVSIALALFVLQASAKEVFPDGTPNPTGFVRQKSLSWKIQEKAIVLQIMEY